MAVLRPDYGQIQKTALPPHHIMTSQSLLLSLLASTATLSADGFYGDPPDATHPWAVHDMNRPQPPVITPGTASTQDQPGRPPSDAIVLFDGTAATLENWQADKTTAEPTQWIVKDGVLQCVPGSGWIRTKQEFADCQLHVEWTAPEKVEGTSQGRGNSGIFLMGKAEVQVLDNYNNPTYADGTASAVYGVNPPMVNPLRAPGQWQTYDIIFRRPVFDSNSKELDPGRVTVLVNGVVTQESTPLQGGGGHKARSHSAPWPDKGPLKLQDHGNPVRYRNIWYRPLATRAVEGGTDGQLTPAAATAKKLEIATQIRADAATKSGLNATLRQLESLCYASDATTLAVTQKSSDAFLTNVSGLTGAELDAKKGDVLSLYNALHYLSKHQLVTAAYQAEDGLKKLIDQKGWDKK